MELKLERKWLKKDYTIGNLYIDNKCFCNTLEDPVRDLNKDGDLNDSGEGKVKGNTAIPYGRYEVYMTYSPKFDRVMPRLVDVQHFEGILLHWGNSPSDTEGCILVGENKAVGKVLNSRDTFERLFKILWNAPKPIYISIE